MKLVTWNVNSLPARMPRVLEFLDAFEPDIALLQETKTADDAFPEDELREAGYHAVHHSAGRWAGVAILAREEPGNVSAGLPGELRAYEARWIEADVGDLRVASVYVTNGRTVGSEWFDEKLTFLDAMATRVEQLRAGPPLIVGGDFNVTRDDRDYALASESLAPRLTECGMVRDFRKGKPTPSDHAPLLVELAS